MKKYFLLLSLLYYGVNLSAQDIIFSQFYAAPLQLNPAFTGNTYTPHFALNYRNQWPSFSNAYVTYSAAYDQFFEVANCGVGLNIVSDNLGNGIYKVNSVSGFFGYRLKVNSSWKLKIGLEAGFTQRQLNWDKLTFGDQIDRLTGFIDDLGNVNQSAENRPSQSNKNYLDISTGFLAYNKNFYVGLSIKHLNTPNYHFLNVNNTTYTGLPLRWTVHSGSEMVLREGTRHRFPISLSPSLIYAQQSSFRQVNVGAHLDFGLIYTGAWFRHTFGNADAAILLLGVKKDWIKIGYSYDITVSKLASYNTGGSHELSLILNFDEPEETNYNDCFNIFR